MRLLIVFTLMFSLLFLACTSGRKSSKPSKSPAPQVRKIRTPVRTASTKKPSKDKARGNAVWHLVFPDSVELYLQHESGSTELIRIETKLSDINLTPGNWQVVGVVYGGLEYEALDEGAKFEFTLTGKNPSYVGSYAVQCPRVEAQNMTEIRKMEFFNRFHFTSNSGTCEMLVGNSLGKVRKAWSKLQKSAPQKLRLGF